MADGTNILVVGEIADNDAASGTLEALAAARALVAAYLDEPSLANTHPHLAPSTLNILPLL